jgi:RNA polymerase primary sigma factor
LCHAALTFDPSRGTFGTWGYACCSQRCNAVLRAERERARRFPEARPVVGDDGEQVEAVDLLTTEPAPEQHAATAHTSILVRAALAELPERERCVMRMRYFDDRTLADIGVILSVSRERARQIHARALGRLRARFA